jgi:hypothetical protein
MADAAYDPNCFYHRLSSLPLVQEVIRQALEGYEKTKDSSPLLSSTLTTVESGVVRAAERARPTYDEYLQDKGMLSSFFTFHYVNCIGTSLLNISNCSGSVSLIARIIYLSEHLNTQ